MAPPRDNFDFRRKAQVVSVDRATNDVVLRLHETDIVRVRPSGDVVLSTGGWATHKTLLSMNDALNLFGMSVDATNINRGQWQVYDDDGTVVPYPNDKSSFVLTVRSKGGNDVHRAKALANAYEVAYTPSRAPAAGGAAGPRVAAQAPAAAVVAAPPRPSAVAPAAAPAPARPAANGAAGGSWANVARSSAARTTGPGAAHAARVTGPGAAGAGTSTAAAAAAAPARANLPPGFAAAGAVNAAAAAAPRQQPHVAVLAPAAPQQQHVAPPPAPAAAHAHVAVAAAPAPPQPPRLNPALEQHMQQLGIGGDDDDDDMQMCVVCMEGRRTIVLVPCGHMALCKDCCQAIIVKQSRECPMCCQPVEYHVEVEGS